MDFKGNSQEELYSINFPPLCIERMDEITSLIAQKVNEICSRHNNILAAGVACFGALLYENGMCCLNPEIQNHIVMGIAATVILY